MRILFFPAHNIFYDIGKLIAQAQSLIRYDEDIRFDEDTWILAYFTIESNKY